MKTEQIIKTLRDWKRIWKPTGETGLTLDAAIERLQELEKERDEAIEIAQTAIEAIQTIYGHAQFCDQCASFEIAKQCYDELNGFERLNFLKDKCNTEEISK